MTGVTMPPPRRLARTAAGDAALAAAPWRATAMRWLRRLHLYSGLAMLPFVLVYAVSAFLFNHPGGDTASTRLAPPATAIVADPSALAALVADALGRPDPGVRDAELTGDWTFEFERDGVRQRLTLPPAGGAPVVRPLARNAARGERVPTTLFEPLHTAAAAAATDALTAAAPTGGSVPSLRRTGAPTLRYVAGGEQTSVSLERGLATHRPAGGFDFGRLLMRLHTAHGYGEAWVRWLWAVVVDLMAASMVLWAVSGLAMWWQKKSHRRPGLAVLLGTVAVAVGLATAFATL